MRSSIRAAALAAVVAAVAVAPAAQAHVTLQPESVPAGGFTRLDVRVPNERDEASTKKVEVKFPPGFIFISTEPVPGWTAEVRMAKLDEPVEAFGEEQTEQVDTVTFSTDGQGIQPGEFQDFGLSLSIPDKAGSSLTFKALQTYGNGEVVRWIGPPDADEPAPRVQLTSAEGERAATAHGGTDAAASTTASTEGDDGSDTLSVVALIVGALGLLAGLAGLAVARSARRDRAAA